MKMLSSALLAGAAMALFSLPASAQSVTAKDLMDADKAFNAMAQKEGLGPAFIAYAADGAILMRQGNLMPLIGKGAISEVYVKIPGPGSVLAWEPTRAEIAQSQDLGYTFGNYTLRQGAETKHGVYLTVWKKQPDGSWKYVADGGNSTPSEAPKP